MIKNLGHTVVRTYEHVKHRFQHKLECLSEQKLIDSIIGGGIPLLVIVVGREIIEDVLLPVTFLLLRKNVHPIFIARFLDAMSSLVDSVNSLGNLDEI